MHLIEHRHHYFGKNEEPAVAVKPGDEVTLRTHDPFNETVRNTEQLHARWKSGIRDPMLTGPVSVEGAEPGNTLIVDILDIEFKEAGFQLVGPDRAIIKKEIPDWTFYDVIVDNGTIKLPCGLEIPARPMVGTFGNAPAEGKPDNVGFPLGGNLDIPQVEIGCRIYIPIEVPGGLFSLGDVHARQGDGEVVGAPEMPSYTTVRFSLQEGRQSEWLMVKNSGWWYSPCCHKLEGEAARQAVLQNARFIAKIHGIALKDALVLLTMMGTINISRTGYWAHHYPVVTSGFPIEEVEKTIKRYQFS